MTDVFIAHVEEDSDIALEIAIGLERAGYTTWCYEVDSIPGLSYLIQTGQAVEQSKAVVLVVSPHSVGSRQVTKEVIRAHESGRQFFPVLRGITHIEFQNRQPEWREAIGAATSISIPLEGVTSILSRMIAGLKALGIHPKLKAEGARIAQISKALGELQERGMLERAGQSQAITREPQLGPVATEILSAKTAEEARGRQQKWIRLALIASAIIALSVVGVILLATLTPSPPSTPIPAPPPTPAASVTFPEKNLETIVRIALRKRAGEDITTAELAKLIVLNAERQGITNLAGIEQCVNLDGLNLMGNEISDISALSSLTDLGWLSLMGNQIRDISSLSNLTNLTNLNLAHNQISDISALSSLTNLTFLELYHNEIRDISPLANLRNLTTLYLGNNPASDISALSSLTNLTELHIIGNEISDISALSSLTNLNGLWLSGNQIRDISPVSNLTDMMDLKLDGNQITDISALSSLTDLAFLNLLGNQVSDIQPLVANSGLSAGDAVTLSGNPLNTSSVDIYIPQLEERGVTIVWEE